MAAAAETPLTWLRRKVSGMVSVKWKVRVRSILDVFIDMNATKSYAQEGEDLILRRIFETRGSGFYIDVGAHHPTRFSNTNFFYKRGWKGLNIEPNPASVRVFKSRRPRDVNLQLGVAGEAGELKYFEFDDPALNTFNEKLASHREANTTFKVLRTASIPVMPLAAILDKHLAKAQEIQFLSVDVEGLDLEVLRSNDWSRYRPECVLVEALNVDLAEFQKGEVHRLMTEKGYRARAKTFNTVVYTENDSVISGTGD